MASPKQNQYWQRRSSHGRNRKFESDDALWIACTEYFEWVESSPLFSSELVKFQGETSVVKVPKPRAMTIQGLCLFIGISRETWSQYRKQNHDFSDIVADAEDIIRTQKFEGAAANLFNPNIIARDLGLAERQQTEATVQPGDTLSELMESIGRQKLDLGAKNGLS